ncbi:MAG: isoleucine--tRNA ligase, partial [Thermoplasmata archaeon]|nr:isoleucine--tRNA ligase [Thermoplasmata archaeon]
MAGWDCHGLPVEIEIEKRNGIRSKKEIEAFGVERFCEACRASTLEVASVWEAMSERLGYWLDYRKPYLTMSPPYIESVWWSLKTLFDKGLLEKGFYVLPYCPRCETPLSSHEVAQGYRETTDPSITVRFPLLAHGGPRRSLLIWTTTPWTIPSNLLVAARADLPYVGVRAADGSEEILAETALARYFPGSPEIVRRYTGAELDGIAYEPVFPYAGPGRGRYRIVLDDMVDASEGTGFVQIAPSFGVEDQRIGVREAVGAFDPLDSRGVFTRAVPIVEGKSFKVADPILAASLAERGLVERSETARHTYPFCWRCTHALIYRALDSWFVRTRKIAEDLVRNNDAVTWVPAHLKEGRFGNFLDEAKDWALSRSRFWGTPLPIWACPDRHATCVGSFAELASLSGRPLPDPFDPHRVTVDRIEIACTTCGKPARREPYTIDAWYDSGSAPFAQYHHPFEPGPFRPEAPLDFVAEGLDQTRGWFYTLLVIATALFGRGAYRAAISNGLVLDDTGQKMSKSRGNAVEPMALLERIGADATRWGFLTVDYTEPVRVSEPIMRQSAHRTLGTLRNVVAFHHQNAAADGLTPASEAPRAVHPLDRWLLSRLDGTIEAVTAALEAYDAQPGALELRRFVDDLSTWYLRRSRPRFWSNDDATDRRLAHETLSYALGVTARLFAPFAPFTAEEVHLEVLEQAATTSEQSVHLQAWPKPIGRRDRALEDAMDQVRADVELGRELRQRASVKSRIPLETFGLVGRPAPVALGAEADQLLLDELNVRSIRRVDAGAAHHLPEAEFVRRADDQGRIVGFLSRAPTPELLREGLVREALRRLQSLRKEAGFHVLDRIDLTVFADPELLDALRPSQARLERDLLAGRLEAGPAPPADPTSFRMWEIGASKLYGRIDRIEKAAPSGAPR